MARYMYRAEFDTVQGGIRISVSSEFDRPHQVRFVPLGRLAGMGDTAKRYVLRQEVSAAFTAARRELDSAFLDRAELACFAIFKTNVSLDL